jgi:clumping factor B
VRSYKAHISTRKNSYAIRKFSIGIASILVGSALFFGYNQESHASLQVINEVNDNARNQSSNSNNENPQDNQLQPVSQVNENNDSSVSSQSDAQQSQPVNGTR